MNRVAAGPLTLAGFLLVPILTQDPYWLGVFIIMGINVMLAVGFWLIILTGQLSLAQGAFMGIGAYTSALLTLRLSWSFWAALPAAGAAAAVVAVALGYPILRLRGAYFAILTFALGQMTRLIWQRWDDPFGGHTGLYGIPTPDRIRAPLLPDIAFSDRTSYYYLVLALAVMAVAAAYRLANSRLGLTFRAIRDAEELAQGVGINPMRYRLMAFAAGCFLAGLAGSLYGHFIRYIHPGDFTLFRSIDAVIYTVVGGAGHVLGPVLGAGLLTWLPELLSLSREHMLLLYGVTLIVIMVFLPEGFMGLRQRIGYWGESLRSLWRRAQHVAAP